VRLAFALPLLCMGLVTGTAQAQILSFKHIVVVVQENRTPDNLFQGLCAAPYGGCAVPPTATALYDIQTSNWSTKNGTIQPLPVPLANSYDLVHSHNAFIVMCDIVIGNPPVCKMDGAASIPCTPNPGTTCPANPQFMFVDNSTGVLNPYLTLATQYGWANYMFQTNQGPSFPAHQFLFGGTSAPSQLDDANGIFASSDMANGTIAGCIATLNTVVELVSPNPNPPPSGVQNSSIFPCFEHQTMADLVTDWMYYSSGESSLFTAPNAIKHICEPLGGKCTGWGTHVVATAPTQVLTDLRNCNFHDLTWITPSGLYSDLAGRNDGGGPSWVAAIVNAIGNSACTDTVNHQTLNYWQDTAIFITWDDWGGWYDHEPPTILAGVQGDFQYGFRVPLIVVSAYTNQGYVDNSRYDFGSILRFIEQNFSTLGLREGELGFADYRATTDLTAFFHLNQTPRKFTTVPSPKDADFFIHDPRPMEPPDDY
jgi:phospholipase C